MRRWQLAISGVLMLLLAAASIAFALGSSSGGNVINPPVDFRAALVDSDGMTVECSRVNLGGDIQLEGDMGRGHLRIPFENIAQVEFAPDSRDRSRATVHLKGGESVELAVRGSATFYGQTPVGLYQIRVRDLKRIDFGK